MLDTPDSPQTSKENLHQGRTLGVGLGGELSTWR